MELKVIKAFNDNNSGYRYFEGDIIEVDGERYKEMQDNAKAIDVNLSDYVEEVKGKVSKATSKE